jgi:hypothetical protein
MKIKDEYKGKTIVKNTSLGNMTVVVDNIDVNRYRYYVSIGFGYLFEKENVSTTAPEQCIRYEGIEADEQTEAPRAEPTPKRKRKTNAKANTKRNQG